MLGLYVSVPIACFRPGAAREFWETLPLPPPSTVYGFLLAMVGEIDRHRHTGVRCTAGIIGATERSTVLRRLWRIKDAKVGQGNGSNVRPDYQQLLTGVRLVLFVDSSEEPRKPSLEQRLRTALDPNERCQIQRFGGLSLGESTHMVDEVSLLADQHHTAGVELFLAQPDGNLTLPVWVDHYGAAGTRYVTGSLTPWNGQLPALASLPLINDGSLAAAAALEQSGHEHRTGSSIT